MIDRIKEDVKQMHILAYLGLFVLAWIVGLVATNVFSKGMGVLYAEATFPVIIGFSLGKLVVRNRKRGWVEILAFPVVAVASTFVGYISGQTISANSSLDSLPTSALSTITIAFTCSLALFGIQKVNAVKRKVRESLYEIAAEEVHRGHVKKGLWAQAVAMSDGDKEKTEASYIRLRVQSILDEKNLSGSSVRSVKHEPIQTEDARGEEAHDKSHSIPPKDNDPKWKWRCSVCGGAVKANYGTNKNLVCAHCAHKNP